MLAALPCTRYALSFSGVLANPRRVGWWSSNREPLPEAGRTHTPARLSHEHQYRSCRGPPRRWLRAGMSQVSQAMRLLAPLANAHRIRALSHADQQELERMCFALAGAAEAAARLQKGFPRGLPQTPSRRDQGRVVSSTPPNSPCPSFSAPATLLAAVSIAVWLVRVRAVPLSACQPSLQSRE